MAFNNIDEESSRPIRVFDGSPYSYYAVTNLRVAREAFYRADMSFVFCINEAKGTCKRCYNYMEAHEFYTPVPGALNI